MTNDTELETRHALALEAGQIGFWTWDAAANAIEWDERARAIVGRWPGPVTKQAFNAAIHPDDLASKEAAWASALDPNGGGTYQVEYRITRPEDGRIRWLSSSGRTIFAGGVPIRVVGVLRDVTSRREIEAEAQRTASLMGGIVSIAADAIISIDAEQRITLFNKGAESIFGYGSDEVIGQPLALLLPEQFRAGHNHHVRSFGDDGVAARRMGERGEIWGRRKSGEVFPSEASISKLEVGSSLIYTAVLRDVTERSQSQALLEEKIEAGTRELKREMQRREASQAQLVRTQRMEAFGQLTGGIAHDFNNLLTVITGNLELLEMRLQDEKERALLRRAQDASEMGARLTSRLLTFARRRTFETTALNLNEHVIGMAELLERTLGEPITLTTVLERMPWTVLADGSEIENAILNLAINARDAMPDGGKLIIQTSNVAIEDDQIGGEAKLPAGDYVRLSLADTGVGMAPEVLQKAFEPFFTTKEPGKGTGLGLSTIYGFAQQARGAVTIYSEVGRGTTVNLYLPRADQPETVLRRGAASADVPDVTGTSVLLVEDNPDVRHVTKGQLEILGYLVTDVASGPAAIELLSSGRTFRVVLSDVVMAGGLSGFDVARWVRNNAPDTAVLLASGYPDEVLRQQKPDDADFDLLRKPYSRSELAHALRRVLDEIGTPATE